MAIAYPGSAAGRVHVTSPNRSADLLAEPGVPPRRSVDLVAIARGFSVAAPDIDELRVVAERRWILLAATDLFEAWAIAWPWGSTIPLHDHGPSSGAVVVAAGELIETTVRPTDRGVTVIARQAIPTGGHVIVGPGSIHDLTNEAEELAVSVHVYGPRLTSSALYRLDGRGRPEVVSTEEVPQVGPFDTTGEHDPG
jgi:predicted metal-dependent enzyme (double-stranded beta helix superfamily)